MTIGAVVSTTVIVNDALPSLSALSVAVHVTVVAPSGNVSPDAGVHDVASGPSTRSDADDENVDVAPAALVA